MTVYATHAHKSLWLHRSQTNALRHARLLASVTGGNPRAHFYGCVRDFYRLGRQFAGYRVRREELVPDVKWLYTPRQRPGLS